MSRLRISFEVEEDRVGTMLTWLTSQKVDGINFEVIEAVPVNGSRIEGSRARDTALAFLEQSGGTIKLGDLGMALEQAGMSRQSASYAVNQLVKEGLVKRLGTGRYKLIGSAPKMTPSAENTPEPKKRKQRFVSTTSGIDVILELLRKRKTPVRTSEMQEQFEAQGRSPKSVGSQLSHLQNQKLIKRQGDGWVLTGKKAPKPTPKKPARSKPRPVPATEQAAA